MIYRANGEISRIGGSALTANFVPVKYSYFKRDDFVTDLVYVIKDAMPILAKNELLGEGFPRRLNNLNCRHIAGLGFLGLKLESALCDGIEKVRLLTLDQIAENDLKEFHKIEGDTFATPFAKQIIKNAEEKNRSDLGLFVKGAYASGRVVKILSAPADLFAEYRNAGV